MHRGLRLGYNRAMRVLYQAVLRLLPLLALLICAGCPAARKAELLLPKAPDAFDAFGAKLRDEDAFYAELKRLQGLYAGPADLALAAPAAMDGEYTLKSRIEVTRAGLTLVHRTSGEEWTLWFVQPEGQAPPKIETVRDEASAGGYMIELALGGGALSISVVACWVQGRYLQLTRELTLGGLDLQEQAGAGFTSWSLEGPWLPYRMAPGLSGPYGVVPDDEADGAWHQRAYPAEAMVPGLAAFDRARGFLLAVADDHPRKLDRRYELSYAIPFDHVRGEQLRLSYITYDPVHDLYGHPYLASGLPVRDSIVLEPFTLQTKSEDPTQVETETAEVITHLADFVHAYHFVPKPPAQPEPGAATALEDLVRGVAQEGAGPAPGQAGASSGDQPSEAFSETLRVASGPWGAKLCIAVLADQAVSTAGAVGVDGEGVSTSAGLDEQQLQQVAAARAGGLSVLAQCSIAAWPGDSVFAQVQPGWLAVTTRGTPYGKDAPDALHPLDIRNPQVAAWIPRKLAGDLQRYPDIAGYVLDPRSVCDVTEQAAAQGPFRVSYDAAAAALQLYSAEVLGQLDRLAPAAEPRKGHRPETEQQEPPAEVLLAQGSLPNLACPAHAGVLLLQPHTLTTKAGDTAAAAGCVAPSSRLAAFVLSEVFGVQPHLAAGGSLAATALSAAGTCSGVMLGGSLASYAGFNAFAEHQPEFLAATSELRVIFSDPPASSYTGGGERPASCTKLIAVLPGNWDGAQAVWVLFLGVSGRLSVDVRNNLTIAWGDGQSWTAKLPVGYWVIMHPSKGTAVKAGDTALVRLKPIAPQDMPGSDLG
jgi:hypothetical protein